jgi:hypothetical protein
MPKIVREIIESFEEHVSWEAAKISNVPGTPGTTLPRAKEEEEAVNSEKYRSIVGKNCICWQRYLWTVATQDENFRRTSRKQYNSMGKN